MAELLLRVRDNAGDQQTKDGDIICAFNNRRIKHVHAEMVCHKDKIGFNRDGLRDKDTLLEHYLKNTYQYKFQRINRTQIKRITLSDMSEEIIGPRPNAKGEAIDVPEFVKRRIRHGKHLIFGSPGSEFWYGGRTIATNSQLDKVWTEIELKTPLREINHRLWPLTSGEKRGWFSITTDDFTDDESGELTSSLMDETDPDNPVMVKKRKHHIDWRNLPSMSQPTRDKILDKNMEHDSRDSFSYLRSNIVNTKVLS